MLDNLENREWTNMTLKDFVREYVFNKEKRKEMDERRELGKEFIQELPVIYQHIATENAKQLDKHTVWISGGALFVIATLFSSERFTELCNAGWLVAALIAFGLSLLFVVSSYRSEAAMLNKMPKVQDLSQKLFLFMKFVSEDNDMNEAWKEAEKKWKKLTRAVKWGLYQTKITPTMNHLAYISFVVGMTSFLIFGTMSLLFTPNCMPSDEPNITQKQQGIERVEKSAEISAPMFNVVVDGILDEISGSIDKPSSNGGNHSDSNTTSNEN